MVDDVNRETEELFGQRKGMGYGELLVDNILGLDNEYESFGEKLGKGISEDYLGFLKQAAIGAYEGAKELVSDPVGVVTDVATDIKDSVQRLGTEDLDSRIRRMYGVGYSEATDEQVNQAREAVLGDALTALELVPAAKGAQVVGKAAVDAVPSGIKADVVGQTKAMLSGDKEFLTATPTEKARVLPSGAMIGPRAQKANVDRVVSAFREDWNRYGGHDGFQTDEDFKKMFFTSNEDGTDWVQGDPSELMNSIVSFAQRNADEITPYTQTFAELDAQGWHKGADGKLRFEISDADMKVDAWGVTSHGKDEIEDLMYDSDFGDSKTFPDPYDRSDPDDPQQKYSTLKDILDHPTLFENYPQLENAPFIIDEDMEFGTSGYFNTRTGLIAINKDLVEKATFGGEGTAALEATLIHEIQHLIQNIEDFESGSNTVSLEVIQIKQASEKSPSFQKKKKEALDAYQKEEDKYNKLNEEYTKKFEKAQEKFALEEGPDLARRLLEYHLEKNYEDPTGALEQMQKIGVIGDNYSFEYSAKEPDGRWGYVDQNLTTQALFKLSENIKMERPSKFTTEGVTVPSQWDYMDQSQREDAARYFKSTLNYHFKKVLEKSVETPEDVDLFQKIVGLPPDEIPYREEDFYNAIGLLGKPPKPPVKPKFVYDILGTGHLIYTAKRGEVEARNAAIRRTMTDEQRKETPPVDTEDTPRSSQWGAPEIQRIKQGEDIFEDNTMFDQGVTEYNLKAWNKGGSVMDQEMNNLMQQGGLKTDGMDKDPVSGNPVPPGSLAKEVRDDVPAQLSEGEYVVPADVVRYFGVGYFEKLRDKAKSGLNKMEQTGRIGGEPMTPQQMPQMPPMPQGVPQQMQAGGYVMSGYAPGGDVSSEVSQVEAAKTFDPTQYAIPGMSYINRAAQLQGSPFGGITYVEYISADGTTRIMIPFINGVAQVPIPEGYIPTSEYQAQEDVESEDISGEEQQQQQQQRDDTPTQQAVQEAGTTGWETNTDFENFTNEEWLKWSEEQGSGNMLKFLPGTAGLIAGTVSELDAVADMRSGIAIAAVSGASDETLAEMQRMLEKYEDRLSPFEKKIDQGKLIPTSGYKQVLSHLNSKGYGLSEEEMGQIQSRLEDGSITSEDVTYLRTLRGATEDQFASREEFEQALQDVAPPSMVYNPETESYQSTRDDDDPFAGLRGGTASVSDSGVNVFTITDPEEFEASGGLRPVLRPDSDSSSGTTSSTPSSQEAVQDWVDATKAVESAGDDPIARHEAILAQSEASREATKAIQEANNRTGFFGLQTNDDDD